jgi:glutamyl-tRNA synthetase
LAAFEALYPPRSLSPGAEVVRVAPSPTGKPHIGTALQAVIDYAFARKSQGIFILRIEDTDRKRLMPGAIAEIVDALRWLRLVPDEGPGLGGAYGPYVESERRDLYKTVADWLVVHGHAYPCFCSVERLETLRTIQAAAGLPSRYDRRCRDLSAAERRERLAQGAQPTVRLAMPLEGTISFTDPARGTIEFSAADLEDPILLKSDGYPTYHLAALVDDHFMRVTTAVRGEEWISSTPKHLVLYRALGWTPPRIVHTPLLRDPQGRKLGKRWGDTSLFWFRTRGYLPDAVRNFITRIIWAHPEGKDVYPFDDFIAALDARALPRTGPVADLTLLDFICGEYVSRLDAQTLFETACEWLEWVLAQGDSAVEFDVAAKHERVTHEVSRDELSAFRRAFSADPPYSLRVLSLEPERYRKLGEIVVLTRFFYPELFSGPGQDQLRKPTHGDGAQATRLIRLYMARNKPLQPETSWQQSAYDLAQHAGVRPGDLFMLLRIALTGTERTPPLYQIITLLGEDEVERRLSAALVTLDRATARR